MWKSKKYQCAVSSVWIDTILVIISIPVFTEEPKMSVISRWQSPDVNAGILAKNPALIQPTYLPYCPRRWMCGEPIWK